MLSFWQQWRERVMKGRGEEDGLDGTIGIVAVDHGT
jgi:hypothetical protein